jgi:hypothetical protein
MHFHGDCVVQDFAEAARWLKKAAEKGHQRAQVKMGIMCKFALGVKKNYSLALRWFGLAIEQGDVGQDMAEMMYSEGKGHWQDATEAQTWHKTSVEQIDRTGEYEKLMQKILDAGMGEEAQDKALAELDRIKDPLLHSSEVASCREQVRWIVSMPWSKYAEERLDLEEAEKILNEDHAGLEKVKEGVLKFLAVESLRQKNSASETA